MKCEDDKYVAVPLDEPWRDDDGNVTDPRLHRTVGWRLDVGYLERDPNLGNVSLNMGREAALALAIAILQRLRDGDGDYVEVAFDQGDNEYGHNAVANVRCSVRPEWFQLEPLTDEEGTVVQERWEEKQRECPPSLESHPAATG